MFNRNILILFFACGVILTSCRTAEPVQQTQGMTDGIYRDYNGVDTTTIATMPWQNFFADTLLQSLIREGIANNTDLQIAASRIKAANATFRQSRSALFPTLNAAGDYVLQKQLPGENWYGAYALTASSSWEIDIWGKLSSYKRASLNAFLKSEAYRRTVQTQVVADIASGYYTLLALDAKLNIVKQTVEVYKEDAETMKLLKEGNLVTGAAVVQSEANRYSSEVTLPDLLENIRETENSLCLLLGRIPGSVKRSSLDNQQPAVDLKIGIPAQLLSNRPDVQEAEFALRYSAEITRAARASFYPSLSITASAGPTSDDLSKLFDASSVIGQIIGGLSSPLFNQRVNRQRLAVAKAQQEESLASFRQTVLKAGNEVSDALYKYQSALDKITLRSQQIEYLQKSVDYTKELLRQTSTTNYTDVLTSEQSLLNAQLNSVNDQQQKMIAVIELYRSLGGGWK